MTCLMAVSPSPHLILHSAAPFKYKLLWAARVHQRHSGSSKDEMKSHKSTRADELAQPYLSWPASTSLIVMVTIGSRSASDMTCRHQFHCCLFLFWKNYLPHSPKSRNVSAVNVLISALSSFHGHCFYSFLNQCIVTIHTGWFNFLF